MVFLYITWKKVNYYLVSTGIPCAFKDATNSKKTGALEAEEEVRGDSKYK